MYRFVLRPRWLAAHVAVVALACSFVGLGLWQLRRLDARRAHDAVVERRLRMTAVPLQDAGAYRRVETSGTYADETVLFGRALSGRPGHHVLTWLDAPGGRSVLVDRGWVPYEHDTPPVRAAAPPAGIVHVEGVLVPAQHGGTITAGRTTAVDVERLAAARRVPAVPYYLLLQRQDPPQPGELPVRPRLPGPEDAPPHLSYAFQWFSFTAIGLVGYAFVIRRAARRSP